MLLYFLDQHRWWFISLVCALTWLGYAFGAPQLIGNGMPPQFGAAWVAAGAACVVTVVLFLLSAHGVRLSSRLRLKWRIHRSEGLLKDLAERLGQLERDRILWNDAQPVNLEPKEVLAMATEEERQTLRFMTLARSTQPKDLEKRVRQIGTPTWEEWYRRFRGLPALRDYLVVTQDAAVGLDVATSQGFSASELEASMLRRIFAARLAILTPTDREHALGAWRDFGASHTDSLSQPSPAGSPDQETEQAGAGTYAIATVAACAASHERGLPVPSSFTAELQGMLAPVVGTLGWRITTGASARWLARWRLRRVLPAIVLLARMRSGIRVRRTQQLKAISTEQDNLARTLRYMESQLNELHARAYHLAQLKFSLRRMRMILPLA